MRDDDLVKTRRSGRAFVPKMTLRRAVTAVVPVCALTAFEGCKKHDDEPLHVIALAMMAFDAAVDPTGLPDAGIDAGALTVTAPPDAETRHHFVLAAIGFDSAYDGGRKLPRKRGPRPEL